MRGYIGKLKLLEVELPLNLVRLSSCIPLISAGKVSNFQTTKISNNSNSENFLITDEFYEVWKHELHLKTILVFEDMSKYIGQNSS